MTTTAAPVPAALVDAFRLQAVACAKAGSALYGRLLDGAAADLAAGGPVAGVIAPHRDEPVGSALALRFLGAVHRLVLEGRAPDLARHYPSAGGAVSELDPVPDLLAAVGEHAGDLARRCGDGVQTNEVGRSAVLAGAYVAIAHRWGLPLRILEVGASAGLNLRWDRYWYDTGTTRLGDPASPVRFTGTWVDPAPNLDPGPGATARSLVAERRGCDRSPIDPASEEGQLTLQSFVWPDQGPRLARLRAALDIARHVPVAVDRADAADWLEAQLSVEAPGTVTVVVHSIVAQYLEPATWRRLQVAIGGAGARATPREPVCWLRMEPGGDLAEVRLRSWPDGDDVVLATAGYHGHPIHWAA